MNIGAATDASFLAPPDEVLDWRRVVLTSTALRAGVLSSLPNDATQISAELGLDAESVRVLLDALAVWDVVTAQGTTYAPGSCFPDDDEALVLNQHAQSMQRWGSDLDGRLTDRVLTDRRHRPTGALAAWLQALGVKARRQAPGVIDACLAHFPEATSVLDIAGGHGEYGMEASRRGKHVTLFDLPEVIDIVSAWEAIEGSSVELFAGDVFETSPDGRFDLTLCFGFSHTQPAERLGELFSRLGEVTTPGGGIAISTFLRGQGPIASMFAIQMLIAGNGGGVHRLEDYASWLTNAGFEPPEIVQHDGRPLLLARMPHP